MSESMKEFKALLDECLKYLMSGIEILDESRNIWHLI